MTAFIMELNCPLNNVKYHILTFARLISSESCPHRKCDSNLAEKTCTVAWLKLSQEWFSRALIANCSLDYNLWMISAFTGWNSRLFKLVLNQTNSANAICPTFIVNYARLYLQDNRTMGCSTEIRWIAGSISKLPVPGSWALLALP